MRNTGRGMVWAACLLACTRLAHGAVTPELQKLIRDDTFEVVMKKPENDPVSYEKPLPLDLLPYYERTDAYRSVGTAFALGHNIYVTAAHVIGMGIGSQFGPPSLRRADGKVYAIDRILKYSLHEDFVVFSLRDDPDTAGFSVNRTPAIDAPVLAVGNALGEGIVIRDGLFTSETPEDQDGRWKWIRFSAAASPGNSGGPLCDDQGRVIGIVIGKSANENLNYSMPISRVLDGETNKARFDQKSLVKLAYLHGSITYAYQDEFALPLPWSGFVQAYQKVIEKNVDAAEGKLLNTYASTTFPRGPGTDDIFFDAGARDFLPRFISQLDDGTWTAFHLDYHSVDLPNDGSVAAAVASNVKLVRLVRSGAASDDAFYADSKGFMDLALKAMSFERAVGPDKVRVTSLGRALGESIYTDPYGRKWQERVWAVPYLDAYLVALLLPTPDGYDALIGYAPSGLLFAAKKETRGVAAQVGLSYTGTLEQWQAMLRRSTLLPETLSTVKLSKAPEWTLATPLVISTIPAAVMSLDAKSLLSLNMGFVHDGDRTRWDIQEISWIKNNRRDEEVAVWRRPQPRPTAKLELRNGFDSILSRRTPYDGTLDRETNEVYAVSRVLDVHGAKAGSISSDLVYGITLRTAGRPPNSQSDDELRSLTNQTRILETGNGEGKPSSVADNHAADSGLGGLVESRDAFEQKVLRSIDQLGPASTDVRGHVLGTDGNAMLADLNRVATPALAAKDPDGFRAKMLIAAITLKSFADYWQQSVLVMHDRDVWLEFLRRNQLPGRTHDPETVAAEQALLDELKSNSPNPQWVSKAHNLHTAYVKERSQIGSSLKADVDVAKLMPSTGPCPPPAATTSGTLRPKFIRSSKTAEDYWPIASKRLGEEGSIVTGLKISDTGCVIAEAIVVSSGSDMLDHAALEFAQTLEYAPSVVEGKPSESTTPMRIIFKLHD